MIGPPQARRQRKRAKSPLFQKTGDGNSVISLKIQARKRKRPPRCSDNRAVVFALSPRYYRRLPRSSPHLCRYFYIFNILRFAPKVNLPSGRDFDPNGQAVPHRLLRKAVMDLHTQVLCKSVFKDGRAETTRENFTRRLTELINQVEAGKQTLAGQ